MRKEVQKCQLEAAEVAKAAVCPRSSVLMWFVAYKPLCCMVLRSYGQLSEAVVLILQIWDAWGAHLRSVRRPQQQLCLEIATAICNEVANAAQREPTIVELNQ